MIVYSTQFPVNSKLDKNSFVNMVIKWNQGSKYDKFQNLEWDGNSYVLERSEGVKRLYIDELPHKNVIASRFEKEDEHGLWKTDFILNLDLLHITIRVALETTEFTTDFYPTYYPPFFVKQVIYNGMAGIDGILPVDKVAYSLDDKKDYVDSIMSCGREFSLPIVFLSKMETGDFPIDVSALAFKLQGVAHVIYEGDIVILDKYSAMLGCEAKNGMIFIYYPNKHMKRKVINLFGSSNDNPNFIMTRITNAVYEYSNQVMRMNIDTWEGIINEKLHFQNYSLLSDQKTLEEENEELMDIFEEQLAKTEELNKKLNMEVQKLTVENQALRMRLASRDQQPLIFMGEESDFYDGEIREIILEILEEYRRNVKRNTRRDHLVTDIIENNTYNHIPAKRREQIKVALKGYKSLDGSLRSLLESFGVVISDDGKHYKWTYFGDHRYTATVSKTSSDNRAGMNMASLIDNLML